MKYSNYGKNAWKIILLNIFIGIIVVGIIVFVGIQVYSKVKPMYDEYQAEQQKKEEEETQKLKEEAEAKNVLAESTIAEMQTEAQDLMEMVAETEEETEAPKTYRHEYEAVMADVTWKQAKRLAKERGGHLVTITSEEEQKIVEEIIDAYSNLHTVWIGGNCLSGDFQWITDEDFSYTSWGPGEPNNETGDEMYLDMYEKDDIWYWNDVPNNISQYYSGKMGYVIEWEIEE